MPAVKTEAVRSFERLEQNANPTATPTFSTSPDLEMTLSTLPDVGRLLVQNGCPKPEVEITNERNGRAGDTIPTATPYVCDHAGDVQGTPDIIRHCPTLPDVG